MWGFAPGSDRDPQVSRLLGRLAYDWFLPFLLRRRKLEDVAAMLGRFLRNYAARHQHPANRFFHVIGLPITFVLPVVLLMKNEPWWGLVSFLGGIVCNLPDMPVRETTQAR